MSDANTSQAHANSPRTNWPVTKWVDAAIVIGSGLIASMSWGPVFGGLGGYLAAGGGAVVGGVVALIAARTRLGALLTAALLSLAYLLFGGALALPNTTIAGVIPSLNTIQLLVMQAVYAWKDLLTLRPPAASFTGPAVAPYLAGTVLTAIGVTIATRTRRQWFSLIPIWSLLILGVLWGISDVPQARMLGVALTLASIGWMAWLVQRHRASRVGDVIDQAVSVGNTSTSLRVRRVVEAVALLTVAGFVAGLAVPAALDGRTRHVLRDDITPPLDLHQYASPLTMFRYMEKDQKTKTLLSVSGLPEGGRIRLATVDAYDGIVYNVDSGATGSGGFAHVGDTVAVKPVAKPTTMKVTVGDYAGVWVPAAGDVQSIDFHGAASAGQRDGLFYNPDTGTLLTTQRVSKGSSYTVDVAMPPTFTADELRNKSFGTAQVPAEGPIPEDAVGAAGKFVGSESTPYGQAAALEKHLRDDGFFSDGSKVSSRPGHTMERIGTLFSGQQMVGDDEQYAVAMALMARKLNMPARVVMGFYPDKYKSGTINLTGDNAHVWTEINFAGAGWVPFNPTPTKPPQEKTPAPQPQPQPQVLQPPDPPKDPPKKPLEVLDQKSPKDEKPLPPLVKYALIALGVAAGVALVLGGPLLLIASLKTRRRRNRRRAAAPADRLSGGWDEILDHATDLGDPVPTGLTRQEGGRLLARRYPRSNALRVAQRADAGVFGAGVPQTPEVEQLWREVETALAAMNATVGPAKRLKARFSPRSLVKGRPRPPRAQLGTGPDGHAPATVIPRRDRSRLGRKRR